VSASLMQTLTRPHARTGPAPDLVAFLAARDAAALAQVYDEHQPALCAFCQRLLGDRAAAEDLVHDVFMRLPDLIHKLEAGRSLRAFLQAIAANRAKHHLRAASRRRKLAERFAAEPCVGASRPDHVTEQRWIGSRIALALERLPNEQQAAFVLAELEGHDTATVARRLHIPEATARTRLFHARRKLRAILSAWGLVAVLVASAAFAASQPAVRAAVVSCVQALFGSAKPGPRRVSGHAARQLGPPHLAVPTPDLAPPSSGVEAAEPAPIAVDSLPALTPAQGSERHAIRAAPAPSNPTDTDPELASYRAAHRTHFDGTDPAASLRAWDQYLADFPAGSFATDARFNRALCLIRLGRHPEARAALEPLADAPTGSYRQREAESLVEGLSVGKARASR